MKRQSHGMDESEVVRITIDGQELSSNYNFQITKNDEIRQIKVNFEKKTKKMDFNLCRW